MAASFTDEEWDELSPPRTSTQRRWLRAVDAVGELGLSYFRAECSSL